MNKIYLILLITQIASTLCMEMKQPKKQLFSTELYSLQSCQIYNNTYQQTTPSFYNNVIQPDNVFMPLGSNITPIYITQQQAHTYHGVANQPDWQQLDKIMAAPYINESKHLAPIYKTTEEYKKETEKTLLQKSISSPPDYTEAMQKVYKRAHNFMVNECKQKADINILITLTADMNWLKHHGITEDRMGAFAYHTYRNNLFGTAVDIRVIPFFSCLKRYNNIMTKKKKSAPYSSIQLTQLFENTTHITEKPINLIACYADTHPKNYPLLYHLVANINNLHNHETTLIQKFVKHIYATTNIIKPDFITNGSYADATDEFYHNAYNFLVFNDTPKNLLYLLHIIETIKKLNPHNAEHNLGQAVLALDPTILPIICSLLGTNYDTTLMKNRISIVCKVIEKYNQTRAKKITPTELQWEMYYFKENTNIALPDTFTHTSFDETTYAFKELVELNNNIMAILTTNKETLQQCVDVLFPPI